MDKFKVFIALISCKKNSKKAQACRETWLSTLPSNYEFRIFTADENVSETTDDGENVVLGGVHDDYEHLPEKVINTFDYINKNFEYDYIAKIDDDVYFNPSALDNEDFDGYDYIGNFVNENEIIKFAQGGTYFVSKKLCSLLTDSDNIDGFPSTGYEDVELAIATLVELPKSYWNYNDIGHKYKMYIGSRHNDTYLNNADQYSVYFISAKNKQIHSNSDKILKFIHKLLYSCKTEFCKTYYIFDKNNSANRIKIVAYDNNLIHSVDMSIFGNISVSKESIEIDVSDIFSQTDLISIGKNIFVHVSNTRSYECGNIELFEYDSNLTLSNYSIQTSSLKGGDVESPRIIKANTIFLSGWKDSIYYFGNGTVSDRYLNETHNKIVNFDKRTFYVDFQNGSLEKFIYEPYTNTVYNVPFKNFENSSTFNYSDCKNVCYLVNDPNYKLIKDSEITIDDILAASINSSLYNGYNVKLYTFQTILGLDRFESDNIEIIDATEIVDVNRDLVNIDNYELFKQLFKFLIIHKTCEEVIIADDSVFFNSNRAIYGFNEYFSYIHLDKKSDNSIDRHLNTISTLVNSFFESNQYAEISDKTYINNIIKLMMQPLAAITKNNDIIEDYLPQLKNDLAYRYIFDIDRNCIDSYIKSLVKEITVMILDRQKINDAFDNINYKSIIGQYFI